MKTHYIFKIIFTLLFLNTFYLMGQSKNTLALGFNITHFSDWDKRPFNFFNPEIIYLREPKNNKGYSISIDGFYSQYPRGQKAEVGDIFDRLIFSAKGNYLYKVKNTIVGIETNVRYRSEKEWIYFYPPVNSFEGGIKRNAFFNFGANANLQQQLIASKRNKIFIKLNYSLYNKGRNLFRLTFFMAGIGKAVNLYFSTY